MTTQKQVAANRANARRSTGAKTATGKAVVSGNAIKHGLLSNRILLGGEDAELFGQLRGEMMLALRPVGILEISLAEKIAAALWKQRRLIEAETASIELSRSAKLSVNRRAIKAAMGLEPMASDVRVSDLEPIGREGRDDQKRCRKIIAEFLALDEDVLDSNDLVRLEAEAPAMFAQFKEEAESDEEDDAMSEAEYLGVLKDGLAGWARSTYDQCESELEHLKRREMVQEVAKLVVAEKSAPITNELMIRYQVALDGELYRAMDQMRKQQEWRIKSATEIEAEVVE